MIGSSFIQTGRVPRIIERLRVLIKTLDDHNDLAIHRRINQFYYMQKVEELQLLAGQFAEIHQRLEVLTLMIDTAYPEVFYRWKDDVRWLHAHFRGVSGSIDMLDHQ